MPKVYASVYLIEVLMKNGFVFVSQKGSHCKYSKDDKVVIVPHPKKRDTRWHIYVNT